MGELYKALYDYEAQRSDEVSLKIGDIVRIVQQDSEEWWIVQHNDTQQQGAVPSNFLEKVSSSSSSNNNPVLAKVLQDYEAQDPEELSLWLNGIVTVLDQSIADGWWKGDLNGKIGVFPANHVKLIDTHEQDTEINDQDKSKRQSFKLAAYGVKQGGIGSILAGGFSLRKKSTKRDSLSSSEDNQSVSPPPSSSLSSSINKSIKDEENTPTDQNVISAYEPQNEDEMKLIPGGYVVITDKLENQGWWKGLNEQNEEGIFPSNFVQIIPKDGTPARPTRVRPPTIKTDTTNGQQQQPSSSTITSPTSMAKPPPVPTGTRPTSLLTRRSVTNNTTTAEPSPPPPRPITSPPVPTRRPSSLVKDQPKPTTTHRRTPSIPLVSPDLPPIQQNLTFDHHHPVRPSRPVPPPSTTTSSQSSTTATPTSPVSESRSSSLAKPPKNYPAKPSGVPPTPQSRPNSQASSIENTMNEQRKSDDFSAPAPAPRVPKRTMPSIPTQPTITEQDTPTQEHDHQLGDNEKEQEEKEEEDEQSIPPPLPAPRNTTNKLNNNSNNNNSNTITDPLEIKFRQWFQEESKALRQYFNTLLEEERNHRMKLEEELALLKQQLN
ncbi:SH3 domain-containing protein [Cunninghamella echinulata]|nr:SH3 domain-containing protein [Cunninghamella echinulata]